MNIASRFTFFVDGKSYPWDYRVAYLEKASGNNNSGALFSSRFKIFPRHDDIWSATYSIKNSIGNDHRCIGDMIETPYVGAYNNRYRFGENSWKESAGIATQSDKVVTWRKIDQNSGYIQIFVNRDPSQQITYNENLYQDMVTNQSRSVSERAAYTMLFYAGYSRTYGQYTPGHAYPYAYLGSRIYDYLYITVHSEYEQYGVKSQHLIPCVYQGEPTFYDEFNDVFLEKLGSGTFTPGPQVKDDGSDIVYP